MTFVSLFPQRIAAGFIGSFGALGLFLAAIGLFGLMSYAGLVPYPVRIGHGVERELRRLHRLYLPQEAPAVAG